MTGSVPSAIVSEVEAYIGAHITGFKFVSGGCINHAGRLDTSAGPFFIKWNDRAQFPRMLEAEARGLALLREAGALHSPSVVMAAVVQEYQFLVLGLISPGMRAENYWQSFGKGLAGLHRQSAGNFGLDYDNYIGSLPQKNSPCSSWTDFFVSRRLEAQLELAVNAGKMNEDDVRAFGRVFARLQLLMPTEPPALLHGDLWAGNLMISADGNPCLIDPAVYYGHREADLAMTQLFGGFDPAFFGAYEEVYPLSGGFAERCDLYNLYPLLVHVNLFGGGYRQQAMSVVRRFA